MSSTTSKQAKKRKANKREQSERRQRNVQISPGQSLREGRMQDQTTSSPLSSSDRSSSSAPQTESKEGMDSDEDIGRVPEFGMEQGGPSTSGREQAAGTAAGTSSELAQSSSAAQASARRRGRSLADKEHRRLKRLLRNRVSAQQARERKKAYVTELEAKVKDLEKSNSELEERLSTLQNENQMLRQILKNTTVNRRGPGSSAGGGSQ